MIQLNVFKDFKASSSSSQVALPSPNGPLSCEITSTAISEANKEVQEVIARDSITKKRRNYQKYTPKQKATIGNYVLLKGTSAAHHHYTGAFPDLKHTTICEWRKAISNQQKKEHESVTELHGKERG